MFYDVTLTLLEEMLGTASSNPDIYKEFIESKRPENGEPDDESAMLPPVADELQKATTVFRRTPDGKPMLLNYLIKGFMKDACSALRRREGVPPPSTEDGGKTKKVRHFKTESGKITAFKKEIDGLIFVTPRQIVLELPPGGTMGICQRPLRAQTAQGERVSLARSETVPTGTKLRFQVQLLADRLEDAMHEWFEYGELRGLGQWRNSGAGAFTAEIVKVAPVTVAK